MDKYFKNIDKQIQYSQGKNIFLDNQDIPLKFIEETIKVISDIKELSTESEKIIIDYTTDKAIEEFCRVNQYYSFNKQAINDLRKVYSDLFSALKSNDDSLEKVHANHYKNLKEWLIRTNPFSEKIYSQADRKIEPVACSEYSPELQITILKINLNTLTEPVLDIGCGKNGNLVNYLTKLGIKASGIDRFTFNQDSFISFDWLEYDYGCEQWGTITSNLGFSNHFKHHNLREDGNFIGYAKKYMEILKSLKIGGSFHYAPDLPFIERYLDTKQFEVNNYETGDYDFKSTIIRRLG